jgi:hypothetical protein
MRIDAEISERPRKLRPDCGDSPEAFFEARPSTGQR